MILGLELLSKSVFHPLNTGRLIDDSSNSTSIYLSYVEFLMIGNDPEDMMRLINPLSGVSIRAVLPASCIISSCPTAVSYTHLRAHET